MRKTRKLTGIWILGAAAILVAGAAFADEFDRAAEPFVRGAQINDPGYRAPFTGREVPPNYQDQGDESGTRTTFYTAPVAPVSAFAPRPLTLQRPWGELEDALGRSN